MRKLLLLSYVMIATLFARSQNYTASWESLDSRPVPQWYKDAKFGIFIHWGVYSVPGYSPKGSYAEWYQNRLRSGDSATIKYQNAKFGNTSYYDFAKQFKAELFNPDEWANLFEQSGAKYIVLTSKHHDGFCLWPSEIANDTWGFPWNAADAGPHRDLLGDLFKAVRKTSVHAGMYYSLYEWYNPLWLKNKPAYAITHAWPQMKELINNYQPDVFWTDGDWEAGDSIWKSKEFLAWLYNESPVKNRVVTYDRWGDGIRFKHGGVYTPEYQPDLDFEDHYWEESRGMGFSYGYNREEDVWDYNSAQSLVLNLIDKVSRGGNFLLDIGPDEHGKIPPIMQERLLQIGEWLKLNGEAIYNTERWKVSSQWSTGRTDYKPSTGSGDVLLKLTINPDSGYAVKEFFYTYNPTTNSLYAIFPKYPTKKELVLKDIILPAQTAVNFLSTKENITWRQSGDDVIIQLPEYDPDKIKAPYAYAVKISNYGKFTHKPQIHVNYETGSIKPIIEISAAPGSVIYYTTDGDIPTQNSKRYESSFTLNKTAEIKAVAIEQYALSSAIVSSKVIRYEWLPPVKTGKLQQGIRYRYYEPSGEISLGSINVDKPVKSGIAKEISINENQRKEKFAFAFEGYIKIDADGLYNFFTESDDGSKLFIDDTEVVNNDGSHSATEQSGKAALRKGYHKISVLYFDGGGDNALKVMMQAEKGTKKEISSALYYTE
jgi:alpha-L-fucosidase